MGACSSELTARLAAVPFQAMGVVETVADDGVVRVRTDLGPVDTARATSCLLQPRPGDKVWIVDAGPAGAYVVAVLERPSPAPLDLVLDADATLRVRGKLGIDAQALTVKAAVAQVFVQTASLFGKSVSAAVAVLSITGNRLESYFDNLVQSSKVSLRNVEQADLLNCGMADYRTQGLMKMHGQNVIVTADELVKADGKQIHFG